MLSTLGTLTCIQYCVFKLESIRRGMLDADVDCLWGEEAYTLWLSQLPVGATAEQVKEFLVRATDGNFSEPELDTALYSLFIHPTSGDAFVTFTYTKHMAQYVKMLPPTKCCSAAGRMCLMGRGKECVNGTRSVQWRLGVIIPESSY